MPYMGEHFQERMKRLRQRAGFTSQQAAADAIGCPRGTVGMWESPSSEVRNVSRYLLAVAKAYKVRPEYVNTGEGPDGYPWAPGEVVELPAPALSPDETIRRLQNDVRALNYALGAMVAAMTRHRPTEAKAVADLLRRRAPEQYLDYGLLPALLATLDAAEDGATDATARA
jgi:transcriptional regulator with XRE-family HTH domain